MGGKVQEIAKNGHYYERLRESIKGIASWTARQCAN